MITPERWLKDFERLDIDDEVRPLILKENAARLLGLRRRPMIEPGGPAPDFTLHEPGRGTGGALRRSAASGWSSTSTPTPTRPAAPPRPAGSATTRATTRRPTPWCSACRRTPSRSCARSPTRTGSRSRCCPTWAARWPRRTASGSRSPTGTRNWWGNQRSSVLVDPEGNIARVFPNVKPAEHDRARAGCAARGRNGVDFPHGRQAQVERDRQSRAGRGRKKVALGAAVAGGAMAAAKLGWDRITSDNPRRFRLRRERACAGGPRAHRGRPDRPVDRGPGGRGRRGPPHCGARGAQEHQAAARRGAAGARRARRLRVPARQQGAPRRRPAPVRSPRQPRAARHARGRERAPPRQGAARGPQPLPEDAAEPARERTAPLPGR